MKKSLFISIFFFLTLSAHSQNWESLGSGLGNAIRAMYSDTVDNYLYATGNFDYTTADGRRLKYIARWDGVKWDSVGGGTRNWAFAFARYNNELYVGGVFDSIGYMHAQGLGIWKGTYWDTLSVQPFKNNYSPANVLVMSVINNELYIGGSFDSINNVPCRGIAKWNGSTWTCINMPPNIYGDPYVFSICEYNSEIYVGGNFSTNLVPNDTIQDIIKYDGTNWRSVGGGLKGNYSNVASMVVYNNELYVGGYLNVADGNHGNYIQKWNGSAWSDVGGGVIGIGGSQGQISKLLVHDNKLYAMGWFETAGGIPAQYITTWDGTNWCGLGSTFDNVILTGCIYNDTVCVAGGFWTIDNDTMNHISKWIGGNFVDTCGNTTGVNEINNDDSGLFVYPNPTNNLLNINFANDNNTPVKFIVYNTLGEIVQSVDMGKKSGLITYAFDLSNYANGVYFIQVQNSETTISKKFIKQ